MYTVSGIHQIISQRLRDAQSGQGKLLVAHSSRSFYSVVPYLGAHMIRITPRLQKVTSVQAEKFSFLLQKVAAAV